ncbi:MAG: exodeoxyribonuclease III [Bacteroidetes bacterium]|nr:exodeoxyribonuclease III [Bacteroidota bacterium]
MKIISYNVNGIRAAMTKDLTGWLQQENPDVVGIQETKASPEQIDQKALEALGYHCFWHSAQRKGYSGVGIISKQKPNHVAYGCGVKEYDDEGRVIRADFNDFSLLSVYVPSASNIERLDFKLQFAEFFRQYIIALQKEIPNLIICGDFNICHEEIDIHNPKGLKNVSGFLPIEREWMTRFIQDCQLSDSFRALHPETQTFSWWSYRQNARAKNLGWRLDYHFVTQPLMEKVSNAKILTEVVHSDHCPVVVEF